MPVNANIGWISYALVAIVGAILGINQLAGVTIGTIVTFVGLNKSFTNPITQVSQQINFVVNAAAGAQRVFDLMDQEPEKDEGYVELVNAKEDENGNLTESDTRTNLWAWKHPTRRKEPSPIRNQEAVWSSMMWTLAIRTTRLFCTISAYGQSRAEDRFRRRHRCRKDHHHQSDQPVL